MNNKKMLFVYNPHAGKGRLRTHLPDILDLFTASGYEVTVHPTQHPGDATDIIAATGESFQRIAICGGDGTLHEALNGMMRLDNAPPFGYIPSGTVNDFARGFDLSHDYLKAAETIVSGRPCSFDVGDFNGEFFSYVAAFGAVSDVAYETPQSSKNLFGRGAYILEGLKKLVNFDNYRLRLEHDGQTDEGEYIFGMISNANSVGGFKFRFDQKHRISLNDGLFEALFIKKSVNLAEQTNMINAVLRQDLDSDALISFKTSELKLTFEEPASWTLDGEYGGRPETVVVRNRACALRVMTDVILLDA